MQSFFLLHLQVGSQKVTDFIFTIVIFSVGQRENESLEIYGVVIAAINKVSERSPSLGQRSFTNGTGLPGIG